MRFALLGHPVGHSISPAIHTAAYAALGLPCSYELVDAPSEADLALAIEAIRRGELAGANVTVPHKRAVLSLVDEVAPSALAVGAANVIARGEGARLIAHNTDADALMADLSAVLGDRARRRAAIFGAGGAGLAAVAAAKRLGFQEIAVTTRSWTSSSAAASSPRAPPVLSLGASIAPYPKPILSGLAHPRAPSSPSPSPPSPSSLSPSSLSPSSLSPSSLSPSSLSPSSLSPSSLSPSSPSPPELDWLSWIERADLIVQATSAGMTGPSAGAGEEIAAHFPWPRLKSSALLYDVVYNPPVTPLILRARAHGLDAVGGLGMLVLQAALSLTLWTGAPAPLSAMRAAAEEALRRRSSGDP